MGFSMFSAQSSPIAIDFGTSSVKLLQLSLGDRPTVVAAAELPIPDAIRQDKQKRLDFFAKKLPGLLRKAAFKGRRAICSVPSAQTFIQHMQITAPDGAAREEMVHAQLSSQTGCLPQSMVIRTVDVAEVIREGQTRSELICFAIPRAVVMRYVEILNRSKIQVIGANSELLAMVRSFAQLYADGADESRTTLYVDLGWGSTKVAISHGNELVFARCIQVGGRHFDQCIADQMQLDLAEARAHRLSHDVFSSAAVGTPGETVGVEAESEPALPRAGAEQAVREGRDSFDHAGLGSGADQSGGIESHDLTAEVALGEDPASDQGHGVCELLDAISDELSMCLRYHRSVFRDRSVDRMIFLGGEARQKGLCQYVAKALRLPAHLGDPLASVAAEGSLNTPGVKLDEPQPGWAVACGLSTSPAEL